MFGSSKFNLSLLGWNQFITKIIDFCIEYNIASDTSTLRLQWGWPADSDSSRIQHIALEMTRRFPGNWTKTKRMVDCEKWKCFLPRKDNQEIKIQAHIFLWNTRPWVSFSLFVFGNPEKDCPRPPPPHITEYMGISIERNFEKDLSLKSHERERNGTYTLHLNPFFVRVNFNFQAKLFLKIKDVITINSTIRIYGNRFLKGHQSYRNTLYCRFFSVSRYELSPGREFHCVFSLVSMHLHSASDKPLIFISKIQSFKSVPNNKTEEEVCCL